MHRSLPSAPSPLSRPLPVTESSETPALEGDDRECEPWSPECEQDEESELSLWLLLPLVLSFSLRLLRLLLLPL